MLLHAGSEFGVYKIAMYLQPFLLGVVVLTWDDLRRRFTGRFRGAAGCRAGIGDRVGARGQLFYTVRSMGLGGGGLVEIPFASDGLISQLKDIGLSDITLSDTSNVVLAKLESTYRGRLFFLAQDFMDAKSPASQRTRPVGIRL